MEKRGQITIFIILVIFLVGIILLIYSLPKNVGKPTEVDANKVYAYMQSLIESEAYNCIKKIGEQGGYYRIPQEVYINKTAYWYYEGINIQPFIETIKNETEMCINEALKNTTDSVIQVFGNNFIKINSTSIKSNTKISEWKISINIKYPLNLFKGESVALVSDFSIEYRINFLKLYELATGIINYASLPEFDKCNPTKNCYGEEINFTFFNDGKNLFIKGQTFVIFSNKSREESFELIFAIKRPVKEAFGENKKKLAVLYQDNKELPTFGSKSISVLKNLELIEGVDYYNCKGISNFISKIDRYDVVIITGNLQFQIVRHSVWNKITESFEDFFSEGGLLEDPGELLYGCNEFNDMERKSALKNWVNKGGVLWINDVKKSETDKFVVSYLGYLGYKGGLWQSVGGGPLSEKQKVILKNLREEKEVVKYNEIKDKSHYLLTCPNDISNEIVGTWRSYPLEITSKDEIIIGSQEEAILWIRELGKGFIIFDQFLLKDNLYSELEFNDDLYSKGLAEKYFANVLNYLSKYEIYKKQDFAISLISPLSGKILSSPIFKFKSNLAQNTSYYFYAVNLSGESGLLALNNSNLKKDNLGNFIVDLTNYSFWGNLNSGLYEWQIKSDQERYFSNLGTFSYKNPSELNIAIDETIQNETNSI